MLNSFSSAFFKQALGTGLNAVVSLVLVLWLARVMGLDGFGHYVAVLSGATVGLILLEGGWAGRLYRECAAGGPARQLMAYGVAHILSAAGVAVVGSLVLAALGWIAPAWAAAWVCMAWVALMNLVSARLRGCGRFGWEALWQGAGRVVSGLLIAVCVLVVPRAGATLVFIAWGVGLALVVMPVAKVCLVWPQWRGLHKTYSQVLPFVVMAGGIAWLLKGDMVLLSWALDKSAGSLNRQDVSYYAASTRLTEMGLLLFAPLGNVLLRSFVVQAGPNGPLHSGQRLLWRVLIGLWLVGAAAVGLAFGWGDGLMAAMFGQPYRPAGALLPWVLLMLPAACGNLVWLQWWTARNAESMAARCLLAAGLLMAAAVPAAAHAGGAVWAAVAVSAVHTSLWFVFVGYYLRQRTRRLS